MLKLLITAYGQTVDYTRYLDSSSFQAQEQVNIPTTAAFNLMPVDARFVVPVRMSYVQLFSTNTETSIFSGFVSTEPVRTFQGRSQVGPTSLGGQMFQYGMACTSDEYLINLKAIPFIPAYTNRYQGQILASLANILCPGFFDVSQIANGDLVPYFTYNPTQSWSEVAQTFGNASRFRYKARDKKLWYQPYGDYFFGISYDESKGQGTFDPTALQTTVLSVPYVNDITIIGNVEGGNNREDYFIGDGFTGNFPLTHQVFRGYSTDLVNETWTEGALNQQTWFLNDPGNNFNFSAGALNVSDTLTVAFPSGFSYLSLQNSGVELAGGSDIQVGEVIFADYSDGILGGLYTDVGYEDSSFIGGFVISTPSGVVTSASGAAGVVMQPMWGTEAVGMPVVSQVNHTYVLQIIITSPAYVRYQQTYRTLAGAEYGGRSLNATGNVTFVIQDYNIAAATGLFYQPTVTQASLEGVNLPPFAVMALVNNHRMNLSIVNTTIATMPLGGLLALEGPQGLVYPTGLILPMLPPNSGGFIGPVSDVTGAASGNILVPVGPNNVSMLSPSPLGTTEQTLVMGNGYDLQAAQVTQGQTVDTLAFYSQTLPAAGTRIRFQSWESQASVSRLQVSGSITAQAALVGDDGIRSAIVNNLSPLPRTSEDCDNAALAFLDDNDGTEYNGTYSATNVAPASFFQGVSSDSQYWPTVGRFFPVNAPRRGIAKELFFVSQLTITILEMRQELVAWAIQFGSDLHLQKTLNTLLDLAPVGVLYPTDAANPPNPLLVQNVNDAYLPDLIHTKIDLTSIGNQVLVRVLDDWTGLIEVRYQDTNWGRSQIGVVTTTAISQAAASAGYLLPQNLTVAQWGIFYTELTGNVAPSHTTLGLGTGNYLVGPYITALTAKGFNAGTIPGDRTLVGVFQGPTFTLSRTQFDQRWYLRPVTIPNNAFGVITSRRSKVLRVMWPLQPAPPIYVGQTATIVQFNFNGDQRSIYGIEIRAVITETTAGFPQNVGDQIVLVQKPVASYSDMTIDLLQTDYVALAQAQGVSWDLVVYFFNQGWVYSLPLYVAASNPAFLDLVQIGYNPGTQPGP